MTHSKNNNDYTSFYLGIMIFGFIFYLFFASSTSFFGFHKKPDIDIIRAKNKKNKYLNQRAFQKESTFKTIESTTEGIYISVEKMPRFKSCEYASEEAGILCTEFQILKFVENIPLPENIIRKETPNIFARFIIDEYGYIQDIEILNLETSPLNKFVISHLKKMPKFAKAGFHNNKAVKVQYVVPVHFKP